MKKIILMLAIVAIAGFSTPVFAEHMKDHAKEHGSMMMMQATEAAPVDHMMECKKLAHAAKADGKLPSEEEVKAAIEKCKVEHKKEAAHDENHGHDAHDDHHGDK